MKTEANAVNGMGMGVKTDHPKCPTPWCDTDERPYVWQGPDDWYTIICPGCQVEGPYCVTEAKAGDAWFYRDPATLPTRLTPRAGA